MADRFHNPYNFIPAPPRTKAAGTELGDRPPTPHDRYVEDHWSGKITVTLTTETPLLIPDAARATGAEHKTYPLRVANGKPYLVPTSIKGMLRSAYEMVTNSRLSVFSKKHADRLAYRMNTNLAREMVPARIEDDGRGNHNIRLYSGTSKINANGTPDGAVYAAWLPRYPNPLTYLNGSIPQHKDEVEAWVEKVRHHRWNKAQKKYNPTFTYWRVREIIAVGQGNLSNQISSPNDLVPREEKQASYHQRLGEVMKIRGFVCITRRNADNKHDERIFFSIASPTERPSPPISLESNSLDKQWQNLITDYQEIHEDELTDSKPSALKKSYGEWSRHIRNDQHKMAEDERTLTHGSLCYAHVEKKGNRYVVKGLYPVMLSRELFKLSPDDLLLKETELRPADAIEKLSPADRVFGWVNSNGQGSYRGNLRIYGIQCLSEDAIESFNQGLTLSILGQPKAQQTRFYLAEDEHGKALAKGTLKEEGYQPNQGLRGRKTYPHQNVPDDYWNTETTSAINGFHREYRQVNGEKTTQNRTIEAWVKPKSQFQFEIEVTNLSSIELGALLWLLTLPDGQFHRLGGGKPFGFGSVRLEIAQVQIQTGEQWKNSYRSLAQAPSFPELQEVESLIELFKAEIKKAYGKSFQEVSFVAAFSKASQGFAQPVHYPRLDKAPHPEGKSFEWFVCNEQGDKKKKGAKLALSDLIRDQGLPYSPVE